MWLKIQFDVKLLYKDKKRSHVNNTVSYIFVFCFFIVCVYAIFYIGGWDFFEFFYLGGRIKAELSSPFANYKAKSRWKDFLYEVFVSVHINSVFYWKIDFILPNLEIWVGLAPCIYWQSTMELTLSNF